MYNKTGLDFVEKTTNPVLLLFSCGFKKYIFNGFSITENFKIIAILISFLTDRDCYYITVQVVQ